MTPRSETTGDFRRYGAMRDSGASPEVVCRSAIADGHDPVTLIRLLRWVFQLSLVKAKEVRVRGEGLAGTLAEYQEKLVEPLRIALEAISEGETEPGESGRPEVSHESNMRTGSPSTTTRTRQNSSSRPFRMGTCASISAGPPVLETRKGGLESTASRTQSRSVRESGDL
jgi:hypothetical protein